MAENLKKFLKSLIPAGILAASLLTMSGCADEPSPVGSFLIPRSDLVSVDTVTIVARATSGEKAVPFSFTASRSTVVLGKTADGFEAWAFLHFYGFPDSLINATVQSAEVRLQKLYSVGDSSGTLSFSVHKALSDWNRDSFVFDSLSTPGIYDPTPFTPGTVEDNESIRFSLDTTTVRQWAQAVSDTSYKNFGVVLKPAAGSVIRGFQSASSDSVSQRPVLTVRYTMTGSAQVDTLLLTTALDKFVAGMSDTTILRDSMLVPARGGAAYRGIISIDVSPVPAHAAIHNAILDLTFDGASSRLASNQERTLLVLYGGVLNPIQTGDPISTDSTIYRFNITEFVQAMVRNVGDSKIRLAVQDEVNSVGLFMMHGSAAPDPAKRPKVTILYSPTR